MSPSTKIVRAVCWIADNSPRSVCPHTRNFWKNGESADHEAKIQYVLASPMDSNTGCGPSAAHCLGPLSSPNYPTLQFSHAAQNMTDLLAATHKHWLPSSFSRTHSTYGSWQNSEETTIRWGLQLRWNARIWPVTVKMGIHEVPGWLVRVSGSAYGFSIQFTHDSVLEAIAWICIPCVLSSALCTPDGINRGTEIEAQELLDGSATYLMLQFHYKIW